MTRQWTATLYDIRGNVCAAMGYGMYAEGDTAEEARASAEAHMLRKIALDEMQPDELPFAIKANALIDRIMAEGFRIEVRPKR